MPMFYVSAGLDTNRIFESCLSIRCLAYKHILRFSIFAAGFSFAFGNLAHYCVVLLNAPRSDQDKKMSLLWIIFPGKS